MSKEYQIGDVVTGKVTGIQGYGAFVALNDVTQGLVHISEITNGYVKDIREFLSVGEELDVKILSINEMSGKIGLSIRATRYGQTYFSEDNRRRTIVRVSRPTSNGFATLERKLGEWIAQSAIQHNVLKS